MFLETERRIQHCRCGTVFAALGCFILLISFGALREGSVPNVFHPCRMQVLTRALFAFASIIMATILQVEYAYTFRIATSISAVLWTLFYLVMEKRIN